MTAINTIIKTPALRLISALKKLPFFLAKKYRLNRMIISIRPKPLIIEGKHPTIPSFPHLKNAR